MKSKTKTPVRFDMNGLDREHRELYRVLREFGFERNDANLVVFGAVIQSGGWQELAMRMLGIKVTFAPDAETGLTREKQPK